MSATQGGDNRARETRMMRALSWIGIAALSLFAPAALPVYRNWVNQRQVAIWAYMCVLAIAATSAVGTTWIAMLSVNRLPDPDARTKWTRRIMWSAFVGAWVYWIGGHAESPRHGLQIENAHSKENAVGPRARRYVSLARSVSWLTLGSVASIAFLAPPVVRMRLERLGLMELVWGLQTLFILAGLVLPLPLAYRDVARLADSEKREYWTTQLLALRTLGALMYWCSSAPEDQHS